MTPRAATTPHLSLGGAEFVVVLKRLLATVPPPTRRSATAIAPCCCWASERRSELVALKLGDITVVPNRGLRLLIRRSKTNQYGGGHDIAI